MKVMEEEKDDEALRRKRKRNKCERRKETERTNKIIREQEKVDQEKAGDNENERRYPELDVNERMCTKKEAKTKAKKYEQSESSEEK